MITITSIKDVTEDIKYAQNLYDLCPKDPIYCWEHLGKPTKLESDFNAVKRKDLLLDEEIKPQMALLDIKYPTENNYKVTGTSSEAAQKASTRSATLRSKVLEVLKQEPMSSDQCATKLGETVLSIRPRFTELQKLGYIRKTDKRVKNESGCSANVWEVI